MSNFSTSSTKRFASGLFASRRERRVLMTVFCMARYMRNKPTPIATATRRLHVPHGRLLREGGDNDNGQGYQNRNGIAAALRALAVENGLTLKEIVVEFLLFEAESVKHRETGLVLMVWISRSTLCWKSLRSASSMSVFCSLNM